MAKTNRHTDGQTDRQTDMATLRLNWPRGRFSENKTFFLKNQTKLKVQSKSLLTILRYSLIPNRPKLPDLGTFDEKTSPHTKFTMIVNTWKKKPFAGILLLLGPSRQNKPKFNCMATLIS